MYAGVPHSAPSSYGCVGRSAGSSPGLSRRSATPQSVTYTWPWLPTRMLLGLRSQWITPRLCANATASQTLMNTPSRRSNSSPCNGRRAAPLEQVGERLALDQLHREARRQAAFVVLHVVHRHDVRMIELTGDARFFEEVRQARRDRARDRAPSSPRAGGSPCRTPGARSTCRRARARRGLRSARATGAGRSARDGCCRGAASDDRRPPRAPC